MSPWMLSNSPGGKFDKVGRSRTGAWRAFERLCQRALPQQCAFCVAPCGDALVCIPCLLALPRIEGACPRCALPGSGGGICAACLYRPPPFAAAFAAFVYGYPVDRLLHAFKYGGHLAHADFFAAAVGECVLQRPAGMPWPEALTALPLAPSRQRERGFDQAAEIARRVARITGVPMVSCLRRTRDTQAQAALPWQRRADNVRGAFAGNAAVTGRRVALVDDVMTTGATLAAAATALLRAGAGSVEAWTVARTLPPAQLP
jgi:ComF family protein